MKIVSRIALALLCGSLAVSAWAAGKGAARADLPLIVSPKSIQLKCVTCNYVTLHADVPYAAVDLTSLAFSIGSEVVTDELTPSTWADDCGDLVVQFNFDEIKSYLPEAGTYDFTLAVSCLDGPSFSETVTMLVR